MACGDPSVPKPVTVDPSPAATNANEGSSDRSTDWNYDSSVDGMTSKKNYFATIDAKELLHFGFPYDAPRRLFSAVTFIAKVKKLRLRRCRRPFIMFL